MTYFYPYIPLSIILCLSVTSLSVNGEDKKENIPETVVASRILTENDQLGRALKITFLDSSLQPTTKGNLSAYLEKITLETGGFASLRLIYAGEKEEEIPSKWEFLDEQDKPVMTSQGFAVITLEFDEDGQIVQSNYLDLESTPVENKEGYAKARRDYAGTKNLIKEAYYGKDGKPALNKKLGYAVMNIDHIKNDKEEYEVKTYQDPQGTPLKVDGAFKHVRGTAKGDDPLTIIMSYNDMDDALMNGPEGYALHVSRALTTPKNPKEAYLDEKSEFVDGPEGYAKLVQSTDEESQKQKLQYLNAKGEPVNHPRLKWSSRLFKLSDKGEVTESEYYDKEGNGLKPEEINK